VNPHFDAIAKTILPSWEISLAFVDPALAKRLNKKLRGKTYTPNVLSYEVGKRHGEIIICKDVAKKQAPEFKLSTTRFIDLLFIHGLLHLKGMAHGTTMEKREQALLQRFAITHATTHRNRNRHRHLPGKGGGR
jgi:probable rRNA maturation factor